MLLVTTALAAVLAGEIKTPPAAAPQTPPRPATSGAAEPTDLGVVLVTGQRPRGSALGDIPPDVTLNAEQIKAYGAGNINELLTYLEPLTRSAQGRSDGPPVLLVNGRRTSGFQEIRGIPTEAIERVDILPEEVALNYGYRADQRVVNFVLKPEFRSETVQVNGGVATRGGRSNVQAEGGLFRIGGGNRWSLEVERQRQTPLFETERDITRDPGSTPYDLIGNVAGVPFGSQIDPALSAGVGSTAVIAPVPVVSGAPTLANFISAYGGPRTGDLTAYRTLLGETERTEVRGSVKHDLNSSTQATFSASLENIDSRSFSGLPSVTLALPDGNPFSPFSDDVAVYRYLNAPDALQRKVDTLTGRAGTVIDGFLNDNWRWTLTGNYQRVETDTDTGRGLVAGPFQTRLNANDPTANPFARLSPTDFTRLPNDTAKSVSSQLSTEFILNGSLFDLPAGGITSTFKVGADRFSLDSTSTRSGVTSDRTQSRDRFNGQMTVNVPIASRRRDALTMLGDLSVNFNAGWENLSDFGGLPSVGVGANWSPIEPVSFLVSFTDEQGAPSISQLNDPVIATPNVPVFDFATGRTVLVSQVSGGNPGLDHDERRVFKAGVTLRPIKDTDLSLSSTYTRSTTDNVIAAFPTLTPDLEAALPGRFTRDGSGNLTAVDARPLNFDHAERAELRTGFNFSRAFGKATPAAARAAGRPAMGGPMIIGAPGGGGDRGRGDHGGGDRGGDRGGDDRGGGGTTVRFGGPGGGGPGGGGGRGGGMQPGQGRFNVSVYHTYRFTDEVVIRDGLPVLDLLDGAATSSRGGTPRQEVQLQAGVFKSGMGAFANVNWRDSTRIDGGTGPDLNFSDQTTVGLNVFVDLGSQASLVAQFPWLKGARMNLGVQNLFDSRIDVTSSAGNVPLNYQPDYLDPQGRMISLTIRKILF